MLHVVKNYKNYSVLGHMDQIARYDEHGAYPFEKIRPFMEEILTIGSDNHKPEHLGTYIEEAKILLKDLGFQSFCTYEEMRPVFHPLAESCC